MSMKPFNLQAALAGAPVITRDGRAVKIAGFNPEVTETYSLVGWVGKILRSWAPNGQYTLGNESENDLFMAPTERTEWVVRYPFPYGGINISGPYKDYDRAIIFAEELKGTIHPITIQE